MFHTVPEAEFPIPRGLAPNGERSWRWVEFALQIPYFLLSMRFTEGEYETDRHMILSQLEDILQLAENQGSNFKILELQLLSPGYMNGAEGYRLGKIKEIWSQKDDLHSSVFVMQDGTRLCYDLGSSKGKSKKGVLLLAL